MAAVVVEPHERNHLFKVTQVCSQVPERDLALLAVLFGTPLRLTEIAQIQIRDVLAADGAYLNKSEVRPEIAFNGLSRPLYWSSTRMQSYLNAYFEIRWRLKQGISSNRSAYRGLDPESVAFLNRRGQPFALQGKIGKQGVMRYTCSSLSRHYRTLFEKAGIDGATAESGRRTWAVMLRRKGYDIPHIHALLGNQDLKTTNRMLDSDPIDMGRIAAKAF